MSMRLSLRGYARDAVTAGAVAVISLVSSVVAVPDRTGLDALGYLLVLVAGLTLTARHRFPVAVVATTLVCLFAYHLRGYPGDGAAVPVLVAIYTAVLAGHRLVTVVLGAGAFVAGTVALTLTSSGDQSARQIVEGRFLLVGWVVAAVMAAEMRRQWNSNLSQAEQRAADAERRAADAERLREETARRRAGEERLRIARELHDSLTHSISVIKVQAGVAVHLARKRGESVPEALLAIQEAAGDATRELRATLDVLRAPGEAVPGRPGPPVTGLGLLPVLVERTSSTGLPATVTVEGEPRELPPELDRAVYRVVQEALTNTARHAGAASAWIRLDFRPDALVVHIDDDGRATPAVQPEPGTGLTGMRERVTGLGGRLHAGPRPEGGFTVRAEFPLNGTDPGGTP
ncbi:sensor histidine kinase [Streptomyces sp. NPDC056159]|uniref:sensor histidine kinase n=1 Tax=Streptomyces sp. NPDC056159 TaxID=3155537 RepID=UPI00342C05E9